MKDGQVEYIDDFKIKYNKKEGYELYYKSIYYDTFHTKKQALDKIKLFKKRENDRKKGVSMARSKKRVAKKTVVKVVYRKAPRKRRTAKKSLLDRLLAL